MPAGEPAEPDEALPGIHAPMCQPSLGTPLLARNPDRHDSDPAAVDENASVFEPMRIMGRPRVDS